MSDPFFTNSDFPDPISIETAHRRPAPLPAAEQAKIQTLLDAAEHDRQKQNAGPKRFKKTIKYMFISWSTLGLLEMVGVPYATYASLAIGLLYGITREI